MVKTIRKVIVVILILVLLFQVTACNTINSTTVTEPATSTAKPATEIPPTPTMFWPYHLSKSKAANQLARYVLVNEIGPYNKTIIPDDLLIRSTLPEASKTSIPYWTGMVLENKIFVNNVDGRWDTTTSGNQYFYEEQIKFLSDQGFNYARIVYSMSFLSNPENIMEVNEAQLEQLDELISWGLKHNVHIQFSFTGLPGKFGTSTEEENVGSNNELFKNTELQQVFKEYLTMFARRYADIPIKDLSFEILAEPNVDSGDMNIYTQVLTPFLQSMWAENPDRILVCADVWKQVPEQLAALGCSISVHNHIYTVDSSRLSMINYAPSWPIQYLPGFFNENGGETLKLVSENGFDAGKVGIYINNGNVKILADDVVILNNSNGQTGWVEVEFQQGTKVIGITDARSFVDFYAVKVEQDGREPVTFVIHDLYTGSETLFMPTIQISDDGTTNNIDEPQKLLNADFFTSDYLQKFIDTAKKYNVGFLMTEVGTDTQNLTEKEYYAYHNEWLTALRNNNISWAYNCQHNILAPEEVLWLNKEAGFSDILQVPDTPFLENRGVVEFLKKYQ
ncbi:MAG: hypothetical protein C0410_12330 [Anaerolinea sp.]|nr:hypothetical protein [Anaerolinea sp.]